MLALIAGLPESASPDMELTFMGEIRDWQPILDLGSVLRLCKVF
jgi:hypothetical protein